MTDKDNWPDESAETLTARRLAAANSETPEMVTLEFVVRATVDPERYAHEYGDELESVREYIRLNLGQTLEVLLATPNSRLYDTHSHWMRTEISPVHRITATEHGDALLPGQLPFYNNRTGMFEAPCTCGRRFTGNDPDEADSNLYSHVFPEAEGCAHDRGADDLPEPGDRCKDCGVPITWIGPGPYDWEPADR